MKSKLTRISGKLLPIILLAAMLVAHFPITASSFEIGINPAPHIINVNGSMETFVIHTNLYYVLGGDIRVDTDTVTVNAVPIYSWKVDDLGYFDAIVLLEDIEETLLIGQYNLFLLEGRITDDEDTYFWGTEELLVIDKAMGPGKILKNK